MKHLSKLVSAGALLAMLAAAGCSGGNDGGGNQNQAAAEVPDSASVSTTAFIAFLKSLTTDDETGEPLKFRDGWAAPSSETGDPEPLG